MVGLARLLAFCLAAAGATGPAVAACTATETALQAALVWHREAFADLIRIRGIELYTGPEVVPADNIAALLAQTPQDELVLVYAEPVPGAPCVFALSEAGLIASAPVELSAPAAEALMAALRSDLRVGVRHAARAARPLNAPSPAPEGASALPPGEALARLSRGLFPGPIAGLVETADDILVLPMNGLGTLPWALLPLGQRQLVDIAPVTVLPSFLELTAQSPRFERLAEMGAPALRWVPGWQAPLILGDPVVTDEPGWLFPPLPGARAEALAVARALDAQAITGQGATLRAVYDRIHDADLIYLAAHGVSDPQDPLDGGFLALADGRLTARDVQGLYLQAQPLVVLSACESGLGRAHVAGTIGLARAFVKAGASAVVMSLWNVDDRATAELMQRFAARVGQERPARALRTAMLEMRALHPEDAALWAGFLVLGNVSADASGQ